MTFQNVKKMKDWMEHGNRLSSDRIARNVLKYQPKGENILGKPSEMMG
jgi:hypothetical protein